MKRMIGVCLAALLLAAVCVGCGGSGKSGMELENGAVTAEIVSPYSGLYLEYGDRELVTDLCAMRFTNTGEWTISDAQFTFTDGQRELAFRLEMLPVGKSILVAELNQAPAVDAQLRYVDGSITWLEEGLQEQKDCVALTLQPDGSLEIRNTTGEDLPLVRVFFRPTNEKGELLGGPCQSVMADGIAAGSAAVIGNSGWDESCGIVTILVINE